MQKLLIYKYQYMQLYIKNMVCDRCILVVRQQLDNLHLSYKNIQLGETELSEPPSTEKMTLLKEQLHGLGFEVLDDKKNTLVEKIKTSIIQFIQTHKCREVSVACISDIDKPTIYKHYLLLTSFSRPFASALRRSAFCNRSKFWRYCCSV